ncbi:MAG TPA: hypothetical protein VNH83_31830 [Bryobacteraceae bacterium]|nr:hypothetical protein [Bryobacteraceae bacterium]
MIAEGRGNLFQIVARPGAGATYRLQRPLHELIGLPGQFNGWWGIRGPLGKDSFHVAAVIRKSGLDAIEIFSCHGLPKLAGGFVD